MFIQHRFIKELSTVVLATIAQAIRLFLAIDGSFAKSELDRFSTDKESMTAS